MFPVLGLGAWASVLVARFRLRSRSKRVDPPLRKPVIISTGLSLLAVVPTLRFE